MARRAVVFQKSSEFGDTLLGNGFALVYAADFMALQKEITHPDFAVVVFQGENSMWSHCQQLCLSHGQTPIIYMLQEHDPRVGQVDTNEVRQLLHPSMATQRALNTVNQVVRVGQMYRQLAQKPETVEDSNVIEKMFSRLDVHHILDRVLGYFGSRMEMKNLHWFRWNDFEHVLSGDHNSLALELEMADLRSPRMMSYREADFTNVLHLLWQTLTVNDLADLNNEKFRIVRANSENHVFVVVHSNSDGAPLGLILFEGAPSDGIENLAEQARSTLQLMARFIEFGLTHWDSKNLSMKDDLTDLYNRRFLPAVLETEINRASRRNQSFSLLFLDLDYFKVVNDTRGHWIGSKLLKEIGSVVQSAIRSCDFGFRYGGDEFVVVLPDTPISGGQVVAERIRKSIEATSFLIDGQEVRLTVSVGLASYPEHAKTKEQLIQLADQAMYYGKRKSRNIVYIAS